MRASGPSIRTAAAPTKTRVYQDPWPPKVSKATEQEASPHVREHQQPCQEAEDLQAPDRFSFTAVSCPDRLQPLVLDPWAIGMLSMAALALANRDLAPCLSTADATIDFC